MAGVDAIPDAHNGCVRYSLSSIVRSECSTPRWAPLWSRLRQAPPLRLHVKNVGKRLYLLDDLLLNRYGVDVFPTINTHPFGTDVVPRIDLHIVD